MLGTRERQQLIRPAGARLLCVWMGQAPWLHSILKRTCCAWMHVWLAGGVLMSCTLGCGFLSKNLFLCFLVSHDGTPVFNLYITFFTVSEMLLAWPWPRRMCK